MALDLRANTAADVLIGPFVDSTDGNTDETALTLSQADILLSKNGQALTQKSDITAAAHDSIGYYNCELDTTDTNTEGNLVIAVHESGALHVKGEFNILSEAAWDSLYAAKDVGFMDVNIKTVGRADAQETEANNLESACSNYSVTRGLTGTALPAAAADAAGGVVVSDAGAQDFDTMLSNITAILADTNELQGDWTNAGRLDTILDSILTDTGTTLQAELDAIQAAVITNAAGADIAADIIAMKAETALIVADTNELQGDWTNTGRLDTILDSILTDTAEIGAAGAGLTNINLPNQTMDITGNITGNLSGSVGSVTTVSDKTGYALSTAGNNAIWDATEAITGQTHSFETILARLYRFMQNKEIITNSTGAVALRNEADDADIGSQTITDNSTLTTRTAFSWV